jgi:hypothetical protein
LQAYTISMQAATEPAMAMPATATGRGEHGVALSRVGPAERNRGCGKSNLGSALPAHMRRAGGEFSPAMCAPAIDAPPLPAPHAETGRVRAGAGAGLGAACRSCRSAAGAPRPAYSAMIVLRRRVEKILANKNDLHAVRGSWGATSGCVLIARRHR